MKRQHLFACALAGVMAAAAIGGGVWYTAHSHTENPAAEEAVRSIERDGMQAWLFDKARDMLGNELGVLEFSDEVPGSVAEAEQFAQARRASRAWCALYNGYRRAVNDGLREEEQDDLDLYYTPEGQELSMCYHTRAADDYEYRDENPLLYRLMQRAGEGKTVTLETGHGVSEYEQCVSAAVRPVQEALLLVQQSQESGTLRAALPRLGALLTQAADKACAAEKLGHLADATPEQTDAIIRRYEEAEQALRRAVSTEREAQNTPQEQARCSLLALAELLRTMKATIIAEMKG